MKFEQTLNKSVGEVTFFDKSEKYYFDRESVQDLTQIIVGLKDKVQKIIIRSSNPKIFSLGFDPEQFRFDVKSFEDIQYGLGLGQKLIQTIYFSSAKVECQISGLCVGAGFELALACQELSLSNNARMKFVEFDIGLFPSYGGFYLMAQKYGKPFALSYLQKPGFLRKSNLTTRKNEVLSENRADDDITTLIEARDLIAAQRISTDIFLKRVKVKYNR